MSWWTDGCQIQPQSDCRGEREFRESQNAAIWGFSSPKPRLGILHIFQHLSIFKSAQSIPSTESIKISTLPNSIPGQSAADYRFLYIY
jgi:hypothetical protein